MAPVDVVKRIYLDDIKEVIDQLLGPKGNKPGIAERRNSIRWILLLSQRLILRRINPLRLKAEFEVWPEFKLPQYKEYQGQKTQGKRDRKDVDSSLEELRVKAVQV